MNFLLEIGCEEIPHWMIPGAVEQLAKLPLFGCIPIVDATPRRLVVRATGLPERTPDEEQIIKGPPVSAGDKAAEFTAALIDLAKRHHEPGARGWLARSKYYEVIATKA